MQIVLLKAGRSELGQQATASHTGKIASSHAVYADVLEQAGVIVVDSLRELLVGGRSAGLHARSARRARRPERAACRC